MVQNGASPVKITVSSIGKGEVVGGSSMSFGITSPVPRISLSNNPHTGLSSPVRQSSLSNVNPPTSRRSSIGGQRYFSDSKDDIGEESSEFVRYTVHIPNTPDHQPSSRVQINRSYISGTIFSGGFNCVTIGHIMDCSSDSSDLLKSGRMSCRIGGCDEPAFLSNSKLPCECGFLICKDCYMDCISNDGLCPGCKELYKDLGDEGIDIGSNVATEEEEDDQALPLTSMAEFRPNRRLSIMKSTKVPYEFDHTRWLFETKGTYGYGNAVWPKGKACGGQGIGGFDDPPNFGEKTRRPLTRKVAIPAAILSPYR